MGNVYSIVRVLARRLSKAQIARNDCDFCHGSRPQHPTTRPCCRTLRGKP